MNIMKKTNPSGKTGGKLATAAGSWLVGPAIGTASLLIGLLLIAAAGLKGVDLARGVTNTHAYFHIVEVLSEWALGLWLICGLARRHATAISLAAFAAFAGVSLIRALTGRHSCGCFGPIKINPWFTLALDMAVLLSLAAQWRWGPLAQPGVRSRRWRGLTAIALAGLSVAAATWGWRYWRPAVLDTNGRIIGGHGVVTLEPADWNGHAFPLVRYLPHSLRIQQGRWLVILYYHGCPACQHALAAIGRRLQKTHRLHQVARIELPPFGRLPAGIHTAGMLHLRLPASRQWLVNPAIPLLIDLNNGRVIHVRLFLSGMRHGF